jgi:hypothetical protein
VLANIRRTGLLLAALVLAAEPARAITAETALKLVERDGAHATVAALVGTEDWEQVIAGVASGKAEWLQVAEEFLPGADAGANSELRDAVSWALPIAPTPVLEMVVRKKTDWWYVCAGPPVDFPPGGPANYFLRAITAVMNVREGELRPVRDECVLQLKSVQKTLELEP